MWTIIAIIAWILMLMVLVVLHELWHFWAAKKLGVKVLEFWVGIPPKAKKLWTDAQGTEYTLNRIPLWWFVRLKGEDPDDEADFLADDSLITASLWRKIVILLAGIFMNFLTTYIIFVIVFAVGVKPIQILPDAVAPQWHMSRLLPTISSLPALGYISDAIVNEPVLIEQIMDDSPAQSLGLVSGEQILQVNGQTVNPINFSVVLKEAVGSQVPLLVQWVDDNTRTVMYQCDTECVLGVAIRSSQEAIPAVRLWRGSWWAAWQELQAQTAFTWKWLGKIGSSLVSFNAKETGDGLKRMSGPAGVIKTWQAIFTTRGRSAYLAFAWLISLSLALFNLLPIPALDGGRVVWFIIQAVGRFSPQKYFVIENYINMFFFIALMWLGIYILWQDLVRVRGLFGG